MANNTTDFKWDDQKVRDFIEFGRRQSHISDVDYLGMDMEKFKAQASGREEKWKTASVQKKPLFTVQLTQEQIDKLIKILGWVEL